MSFLGLTVYKVSFLIMRIIYAIRFFISFRFIIFAKRNNSKVMSHPFMSASHDGDLGYFVRNIILNSVFQKGQFIIPDIADQTGFSVTTIAKYVSELYAKDILEKKIV